MKIKLLLVFVIFCYLRLKAQDIDPRLFMQLHKLTQSEMLSVINNVPQASLVFNTNDKSVYVFEGTTWIKLASKQGNSFLDVLSSAARLYDFSPANLSAFYKIDACISPIHYNVQQGDIISLNLQLSALYSNYNSIGEVVRFYILIDGVAISNNIFNGFFAGGDNKREIGHVSMSQSFKIKRSGALSVGVEIKALQSGYRRYNTTYADNGGLSLEIYR